MITWDKVAEELIKLAEAMERLRIACESSSKTWQDLIDWINEKD